MQRSCAWLETPIGQLWVTVSSAGLVEIARGSAPPADAVLDPEATAEVIGQLEAYFAGRLGTFTIPLDLADASPFDVQVWTAARTIPHGETASYGELALMAGHPGAARAVGGSMARCPVSPVVPCHRVIHADGSLGGWGSETWVKRWLLNLERRPPPRG
jgi:methylated-DNA-[protein]-cysteine S-methyltransferase